MRVRFLRDIAAFDFGYSTGQVEDVDDALGRAWCASGVATPADAPELAMAPGAQERAMRPRAKARKA